MTDISKYPSLTAAEELDQWENLAKLDDCIGEGRFVPADLRAMVKRLRTAEAALNQVAGSRVMGTPDATSRAQIEALIDAAKAGLPTGGEVAAEVDKETEASLNDDNGLLRKRVAELEGLLADEIAGLKLLAKSAAKASRRIIEIGAYNAHLRACLSDAQTQITSTVPEAEKRGRLQGLDEAADYIRQLSVGHAEAIEALKETGQ